MPIALRGKCKRRRGKCERGRGSANADGAGAKVFAGDGCSQGRLSAPWPQFHGVDRADVYIIIHVRACCCGECALNSPTSPPIPRRRPPLAPAQRHALAEHFRSPTQRQRPPTQSRRTPAGCAMHSQPTAQPIPRRRPPLAPTQRHTLPEHFRSPTQPRRTPAGCAMHARRPHNPFPPKTFARPRTATRCLSFRSASGTKKRHRTVDVRCRMSRSTVVAVGHWGW